MPVSPLVPGALTVADRSWASDGGGCWPGYSSAAPAPRSGTAIWFVLAFAVMAIAWDLGARRAAGYRDRLIGALRSDVKWLPVTFARRPARRVHRVLVRLVRQQPRLRPELGGPGTATTCPIWSTLDSWYQYQKSMLGFGLGLSSHAGYVSEPWSWLILGRPGLVLLQRAQGLRGQILLAGGARDRHAGDLVGVDRWR